MDLKRLKDTFTEVFRKLSKDAWLDIVGEKKRMREAIALGFCLCFLFGRLLLSLSFILLFLFSSCSAFSSSRLVGITHGCIRTILLILLFLLDLEG